MNKKYKLTEEYKVINGHKLYRIQAMKDFSDVKEGELGGYIEFQKNLSQEHNCWIYDDACVMGSSIVYDNAIVKDEAVIFNGYIFDNAIVLGKSFINGGAQICKDAYITLTKDYMVSEPIIESQIHFYLDKNKNIHLYCNNKRCDLSLAVTLASKLDNQHNKIKNKFLNTCALAKKTLL